jgi:hypothetical protein
VSSRSRNAVFLQDAERQMRIAAIAARVQAEIAKPPAAPKPVKPPLDRLTLVQKSWHPVLRITITEFPNVQAAARASDVEPSAVHEACRRGTTAAGSYWAFPESPPVFRPRKYVPLDRDDGRRFHGIAEAVMHETGEGRRDRGYKREWNRLERAIRWGRPYRGHIYRRVNGVTA